MTTQGTTYDHFGESPRDATLLRFRVDVQHAMDIDGIERHIGIQADLIAGLGDYRVDGPVEAYQGGRDQWFVTYEVGVDNSDGRSLPQATRVYLSGELRGWEVGTFSTPSKSTVYGVKIVYERTHESYRDDDDEYETCAGSHCFAKVVELSEAATLIELRSALPDRYRRALHRS